MGTNSSIQQSDEMMYKLSMRMVSLRFLLVLVWMVCSLQANEESQDKPEEVSKTNNEEVLNTSNGEVSKTSNEEVTNTGNEEVPQTRHEEVSKTGNESAENGSSNILTLDEAVVETLKNQKTIQISFLNIETAEGR